MKYLVVFIEILCLSCIYRGQSVHCITVAEEGPRTETFYAVVRSA